MKEYNVYKVTS